MNIFGDNSSNSQDSNADDFEGLIKKVDGNFHDSDSESESFNLSINKRKSYSKRISSLLKIEEKEIDKTKTIKKNCISAKKSRQRKKIYIEVLEQKVESLKQEILKKKQKIVDNRQGILSILRESNPQKALFIEETLKQSKQLAAQVQKPQTDKSRLQLMINSFMYKLGFTGVLRRDLIQQLKAKWYQNAIDPNILMNGKQQELREILEGFKECMKSLEEKNNQLEFLTRKLQEKLSTEQVVRFLLDPRFFNKKQEQAKIFEPLRQDTIIKQESFQI